MITKHRRVFRGAQLYLALILLICSINAMPAAAVEVVTVAPDAPPLAAITVAEGRLMAGDQPFEIRGTNYVRLTGSSDICSDIHFGADGRCPWDQAAIDADMDRLQALGINTVRLFLNYYVFGGARATDPTYSIDTPLKHLDRLIASANRRGIYVLPVLMAKYPQEQFSEAGLVITVELHLDPVVRHLAGQTGVLGWDLFNEPDIGSPVDERCWDWDNGDFPLCKELAFQRADFLARIHTQLRLIDPDHLTTIGMGFAKSYFRPAEATWQLADLVDFYSFHYYDNDPYESGRYAQHWYYGQGFPADLQHGITDLAGMAQTKPVLISELGFPSGPGTLRDEATLRHDLALGLRTARERGAAGVILWPFQPTPEELIGDLFAAP